MDGMSQPRLEVLERLHEEIARCRACPRLVAFREEVAARKRPAFRDWTYWGRPVPGFGDPQARILLLGLAPAAHGANRTGRMFTGDRAGDFLVAALHRHGMASRPESRRVDDGLELHGVYMTAAVRCAPPGNKPSLEELARCRLYLHRELACLPHVRVVVALGKTAWDTYRHVLRERLGHGEPAPRFGHGVVWHPSTGPVVVGSYHPSQQNTQTGRLTSEMMDQVLTLARSLAEGRT